MSPEIKEKMIDCLECEFGLKINEYNILATKKANKVHSSRKQERKFKDISRLVDHTQVLKDRGFMSDNIMVTAYGSGGFVGNIHLDEIEKKITEEV